MEEDPTNSSRHSTSPLRPALKQYKKPRLVRFGGLTEVTQSANLTAQNPDGGTLKTKPLFT
jgi:hypothetical protein